MSKIEPPDSQSQQCAMRRLNWVSRVMTLPFGFRKRRTTLYMYYMPTPTIMISPNRYLYGGVVRVADLQKGYTYAVYLYVYLYTIRA